MPDTPRPPPPPMADDRTLDERIRLHWTALPLGLVAFGLVAVVYSMVAFITGASLGRGPASAVAPGLFMLGGAYLADRYLPTLSLVARWAVGMGVGALLSFGGVALLPAICCAHGGGIGWVPLVAVTALLGTLGTLCGALLGAAARTEELRVLRMVAAPSVAIVPLVALFPWIYTMIAAGWLPILGWISANLRGILGAAVLGAVWSVALGGTMAVGVWMSER